MSIIFKFVWASATRHWGRWLFATLSIIAAACVVIWVVSGYDALIARFDEMAEETIGLYDFLLAPPMAPGGSPGSSDAGLSAELLRNLRQDAAVEAVHAVAQTRVMATNADGKPTLEMPFGQPGGGQRTARGGSGGDSGRSGRGSGREPGFGGATGPRGGAASAPGGGMSNLMPSRPVLGMPPRGPSLVGTDANFPPVPKMTEGEWLDPASTKEVAVLTERCAQQYQVKVGESIKVSTDAGEFILKAVGIFSPPRAGGGGMRGPMMTGGVPALAIYVSLPLAEKINGFPPRIGMANLRLKEGMDRERFKAAWQGKLGDVELRDVGDVKASMSDGMATGRARSQAYSATGLALLAACFIIFTTLSMGVNERIRQFALMRAVGMTRLHLAGIILFESLVLGVIGWAGGLAVGWAMLKVVKAAKPDLLSQDVSLGGWCFLLTGCCSLCGALAAAIIPAWRATRVSPLEAMAPIRPRPPRALSMLSVILGGLLVAANPLLVYVVPMSDSLRVRLYGLLGCPAMALGFVLLTPLAIWLAEMVLGPILASCFRLDHRLLARQLSMNLWRTLGTTVSLTVGLGLYLAIQIWGYSMLAPFFPGDWLPGLIVAFLPAGITEDDLTAVRTVPGVRPERCLPMAVEQPRLATDLLKSAERASAVRQDNVLFIGLEPEKAFGGNDPLLGVKWVKGHPREAVAKLGDGRHCLVPDHFSREAKLGIGDRFAVLPPLSPETPVEYTIAGIVSLPGWHWMTKFSGLRRTSGRTGAMIFADFGQMRRDFGLERINYVWLDTRGLDNPASLEPAMQAIADRHAGERCRLPGSGEIIVANNPYVILTATQNVRQAITRRADGMIKGMSQLPLIILLITSLGVVNTVMASVRARRWEMGVMRAVAVTRSGIVRLVMAEALLLGLVACLLSLGFGLMAGWCGMGMSRYLSFFGGMDPALAIPWLRILFGFAITAALCLFAAVWPACQAGRADILKLLQEGRAAM
jgi:putative ABC transport system permease protein